MFSTHERRKTNFVGRREELSRLEEVLKEVKEGKGRVVMVEGEAGIGKTRFTEEVVRLDSFSDFKFLWGRCLYFKDTDIYLPFKEMFNQYREEIERMGIREESPFPVGNVFPNGKENGEEFDDETFVPMSLIPTEMGYEEENEEMPVEGLLRFDKLSQFIFRLAETGPLLLLIDDLHWADPPSLQLLHYLSQNIGDHPILIICTYRPEDLYWGGDSSHPLADALKRLNRERLYVPITLKKLDKEEVEKIVADILDLEEVPMKFVDILFERTLGNPFFVEEVIYSLTERGVIDPNKPDWYKDIDPRKISLPTTLKDVILRRVHWLKPVSIKVIRFASVTGENFNYEIIKEALDLNEEAVIEALEELTQAMFLKEIAGEEKYEFENPVIQEVIYSELNHSRRRFLHDKLAHVLEQRYSDTPSEWGNIAINFYKGRDYENALKYLTKASSYYQPISPHKALEYMHMVLDCIERLPQSDSVKVQNMRVMQDISRICLMIGEWEKSKEFAERSLNLSMVLKDPEIEIRNKMTIAEVMKLQGKYERAITYYNELIRLAQVQDNSEGLALAYMGIGFIRWREGKYPKALEMFSKSLQYAKMENNLSTIGNLYIQIGNLFNHRGDLQKSIDYYNRGLKHLDTVGDTISSARALSNMGNSNIQLGNLDEAEKKLKSAIQSSKQKGGVDFWWPYINMIKLYVERGEFEKADMFYKIAMDQLNGRGDKLATGIALMYGSEVRIGEKDLEEADKMIERANSIFEELGIPFELGRLKLVQGKMCLEKGEEEEARKKLGEAHRIFQSIGANKKKDLVVEILKDIK